MKQNLLKFLLLVCLAMPISAHAQQTPYYIQVPVIPTSPAIPSTCASLSSVFGVTITEIDTADNIVTVYTSTSWSPSGTQLAQLTNLIEVGQTLTVGVVPASATVSSGSNVNFTASTNASGATYQWKFNGTNIAGQSNAALTLTNVQPTQSGNYSVSVNLSGVGATSTNATLTVN